MIRFLKNYIMVKWWIPILLFCGSICVLLSENIFPNTDFGFYAVMFFGLILAISATWQLFNGKKLIGLLQFLVLIIPILFFGFIIYVFASMMNKPNGELAVNRIEPLIKEKTELIIPDDYVILKNLVEHTEGAFDSDYSIELIIEYKESDEEYISQQITKRLELGLDLGKWKESVSGFDFEHSNNEINNAEPFYLKVDTIQNKINFSLFHL